MDKRSLDAFCSLDEIVVAPATSPREVAWSQLEAQSQALAELSRVLADAPRQSLQRLAELAMEVSGAGSAGLSLEERDEGGVFCAGWPRPGNLAPT